ncbi:MAG: PAS domain S-box-containing protein [Desulforhopalus sp.]|jgi:PAS domain S-box-containing protein
MKENPISETKELMWQSLDVNGKVLSVNDLWLRKMGYTRDEVIGRKFSDFVTPQCRSKVKDEFPHLRDYGFVNNVLLELQRKDGVIIEGVLNGISFYDGEKFEKTSCELKTLDYLVDSVAQAKKMLAKERLANNMSHLKSEIANALVYEKEYDQFILRLYEIFCEPVDISGVYLLNRTGNPLPQTSAKALPLQSLKAFSIVPSFIEKQTTTGSGIFVLTEDENSALAKVQNQNENMLDRPSGNRVTSYEEDGCATICSIILNPFDEDEYLVIILNIRGFASEKKKWLEAIEMISLLILKGLRSLYHTKLQEQTLVELQSAFAEIKTLKGIIPICMHCKGIRDDEGYWNKLEKYITKHSDAQFSHGICEKCFKKHYPQVTD